MLRRPNISNTVVPSNIVIAVGARNSITWAGRVVGMCTRCGIIRERNLLYARRHFVDAIGYTDRILHVSRNVRTMSFFIIDRIFSTRGQLSILVAVVNNMEAFEIFLTYVLLYLLKLVSKRGKGKRKISDLSTSRIQRFLFDETLLFVY